MNSHHTSGNHAASNNLASPSLATRSTIFSIPGEKFVLLSDIATHLGISRRSVQKRMREGLPFHRFGRSIRFLVSEVDAYARNTTLHIDTTRKKIDPRDAASPPRATLHLTIDKPPRNQNS